MFECNLGLIFSEFSTLKDRVSEDQEAKCSKD